MTCVIGFEHEGAVHMMSDSGVWAGVEWMAMRDPKIRSAYGAIIGVAGAYHWLQLLLDQVPPPVKGIPYERTLARAWRDILADEDEHDKASTEILVGFESKLFTVNAEGASVSSQRGIMGIGCCEYALGALETMMPEIRIGHWDPEECLREVVDIQALWTCSVHGPYTYAMV